MKGRNLTYRARFGLFTLIDSVIVLSAIFFSYLILHPTINVLTNKTIIISALILLISHHIVATIFHLYDRAWGVASVRELLLIGIAVTASITIAMMMQKIVNGDVYVRVMMVTWMLHMMMIGGSRFIVRLWKDKESFRFAPKKAKHVLIVGAGQGGSLLARNLLHMEEKELLPVAFIDDDYTKKNLKIYGIPVAGNIKNINQIIQKYKIDEIIFAIPSLNAKERKEVVEQCQRTGLPVKTMPSLEDIITGKVQVNEIREVAIEDLLGREPVKLDMTGLRSDIEGETIMVTGAGGSIGSEICRQLAQFKPKRILLVGHGEFSIYSIYMELFQKYEEIEFLQLIGDVKDKRRMEEIVRTYAPKIIYHAAAHKYVPLMEYNPHEAVKNNIIGTKNVADVANEYGVDTFVLVSTDKAVNPTNVMGATKRVAEMVVQSMNKKTTHTKFVAVRFGNVLGSRGSVIPLFMKQIAEGGPVTVTDPRMTRFFMTIPEASRLVIQAGNLAEGGEVFVLDMGEPVKIVDLAKNLITLSGYCEEEIEIEYTGIRPGEKLYEELLDEDEILPGQVYEKIYVGKTREVDERYINNIIDTFESLNDEQLKEALMELVFMEQETLLLQGS